MAWNFWVRKEYIPLFFLQFRCCFHISWKMAVFNDNHFSSCSPSLERRQPPVGPSWNMKFKWRTYKSPRRITLAKPSSSLSFVDEWNFTWPILFFKYKNLFFNIIENLIFFSQTFLLTAVGSIPFYFDIKNFAPKMQVTLTTMLVVATLSNSIRSVSQYEVLQKPTFYPEITKNLMFEKCEFCEKWVFENVNFVNFVKKWDFEIVNFVKIEILKLWILWKLRFWNCGFCQKW